MMPPASHPDPFTSQPHPGPGFAHVMSFDIEDWFHIVDIPAVDDPAQWPKLSNESSLVERYTDKILGVCEKHGVRATFFVLGWIAERHPKLVARIAGAGHEIATHSFWHRRVYTMTPDDFRADLLQSIEAIQAAAPGTSIRGFRAPSFSITPGTEWAFDVLREVGLEYDASLFPGSRGHGGYACPQGPHLVETPGGYTLPELPMSVAPIGFGRLSRRMCYSGGGYLRLLPETLIRQGIDREMAQGRGTVVYLHPRDFAPDCPRVPMLPTRRFKCYVGLATTLDKLDHLLDRYAWVTCEDALAHMLDSKQDQSDAPTRPSHALGADS